MARKSSFGWITFWSIGSVCIAGWSTQQWGSITTITKMKSRQNQSVVSPSVCLPIWNVFIKMFIACAFISHNNHYKCIEKMLCKAIASALNAAQFKQRILNTETTNDKRKKAISVIVVVVSSVIVGKMQFWLHWNQQQLTEFRIEGKTKRPTLIEQWSW